jgi:hypothetical protein
MMNNILAAQKIRARLAHLNSDLRLSYSGAERHPGDQTSRDRCVMEVMHLCKQIRHSERRLELLLTEDRTRKAERMAAAAEARRAVSVPADASLQVPIAVTSLAP